MNERVLFTKWHILQDAQNIESDDYNERYFRWYKKWYYDWILHKKLDVYNKKQEKAYIESKKVKKTLSPRPTKQWQQQ